MIQTFNNFQYDPEHHRYMLDGKVLAHCTSILADANAVDSTYWDEDCRNRGSAVHKAIQYAAEGDLDYESIDESIAGHVKAHSVFTKTSGFKPLLIEAPGYHPRYLYGATPDSVGFLNGKLGVLEYKSGKVEKWTGLQLAAGAEVIEWMIGYEKVKDIIMEAKKRQGFLWRWGVELAADGRPHLTTFKDRNDFRRFLSCLDVSNWKQGK